MITAAVDTNILVCGAITDTKWVALVLDGGADYLVTCDRRHLQRLRTIGRTKVVGPAAFLRVLEQAQRP